MPKTVLLADDSVTIQKVVGITFANEDIELVTVDNGTDALARARQIVPDLVLADIGMPGLNGYELCAAIRRTAQLAHVPVLLLTGTFESYDETRARSAGASGHISKPFEAQALVDRVWALLNEVDASQGATRVADPLEAVTAPAQRAADDAAPSLSDLPNSSFGTTVRSGVRLPAADPSGLLDLGDSFSRRRAAPPARAAVLHEAHEESDEESGNGVTAFLDPFQDLTPPMQSRAAPGGAPLLPPAEPPDLLDLSGFDPQGDTHPTFIDGSTIEADADAAPDPHIASGESIALVLPDIPELPGIRAGAAPAPLLDAQALVETDPLDLEPLEAADAEPSPPPVPAPSAPVIPAARADAPVDADAPAPGTRAAAPLDRDALHGALEKLAWEAFGSLSQELVEQFTRRAEEILWEVVPGIAERLVREEIERLKGEL